MKKILPFLLTCCAFVNSGLTQPGLMDSVTASLVEAERAFSRASAAKGIRAAFLEYLADDGIIFRPHPLPARKWYLERPATPGALTWEPVFAEVSCAGDLGYTTGPYEFKRADQDQPSSVYGHYVSVWKKQPAGIWKVVLDVGILHPRPETKVEGVMFHAGDRLRASGGKPQAEEAAQLLQVDRVFASASSSQGAIGAFELNAHDDMRFYRMNAFPAVGKAAVRVALSGELGRLSWQPIAADVASSQDLGYTYGTAEFVKSGAENVPTEVSSYVRIWRKARDSNWKVVLDIAVPVPSKSEKSAQ